MKAALLLIAMAVTCLAAPDDPAEQALRFLENLRAGTAKLGPGEDTALAPATGAQKRTEIARRLERVARDLGSAPLEAGPVKVDGEYAAVLVRINGGFDPGLMQVHPVALVKRERGWVPAPVPASFENTGIGYQPAVRQRIRMLEDWMLRERPVELAKLRSQAGERMRQKISQALPPDELKNLDSRQTAERFLQACARHSLPEILGLTGGLQETPPDDWPQRLRAAESALAQPANARRPWRLLLAEEVLRLIIDHAEYPTDGPTFVSIACLDPVGQPVHSGSSGIELIRLELTKTRDGYWRVDPPPAFLQPSTTEGEDESEDPPDEVPPEKLRTALASRHPATPLLSAAAARDSLLSALRDGSSFSWIQIIDLPRDPRDSCARAAKLWWEITRPQSALQLLPLAIEESGNTAAVSCQFFDPRRPERYDLRFLFFTKTPIGWLWQPAPASKTRHTLADWIDRQTDHWRVAWRDALLADSTVITPPMGNAAPQEDQTRSLMAEWFKAIRMDPVAGALRLTARLNLPDSMEILLRNLGYEISGVDATAPPPVITDIQCADGLALVAVKTESRGKPRLPIFPVVQTPAGPRILLETDLAASGGRTRDFLNKNSLERLARSDPATATKLRKLLQAIRNPAVEAAPR